MKKNYLVTGAAGFIASETCSQLLDEGCTIVGVDDLNDYYDPSLKEYRLNILKQSPNFKFFEMDLSDKQKMSKLFEVNHFDAIFNLGARAGVRASIKDPEIYFKTNTLGTLIVLELMKKFKVNKLVLASTSSLYAGQKGPFSESLPVNTPISPYAASKKAAEVLAYTYHHLFNIDVSIVRYFTVYGPAGRPDMSVLRFIKKIDCNEPIDLYGDGSQSRDFTYVDDIARGTITAVKPSGYEIFNLGGGNNPITIAHLISEIEKNLKKKATVNTHDFIDADMKETWADISKANSLLGWKPRVSFNEGIRKTINWYLENKDLVKTFKF